jgi:excisionase family DNA binding protein
MAPPGEDRPPEPERLFTVSDVARRLQVSKMTIYRLIQSGQLTAVRTGRLLRITAGSLREYLSAEERPESLDDSF